MYYKLLYLNTVSLVDKHQPENNHVVSTLLHLQSEGEI